MMDLDATQAIDLSDYDDETDDETSNVQKVPVAHLKVLCQKGFPETLFPVYEGDNLIGRQEGKCNIYLPLKALSREHACIEVRSGHHFIVDYGSRNKTRRGKLFLEAKAKYELHGGDCLLFGDVEGVYLTTPEIQSPQAVVPDNKSDSGSETGSESLLMLAPQPPDLLQNTVVYESDGDISEPSVDLLMETQAYDIDGNGPISNQTGAAVAGLTFAADSDTDTDDATDDKRLPVLEMDSIIEETPAAKRTDCRISTDSSSEAMLNVSQLSSPRLQSTRVSETDFPTLMLPATPDMSSDSDMDIISMPYNAMADTLLIDPEGFAIPSQPVRSSHGGLTSMVISTSTNAAKGTSSLNTDDICTSAYPEPETDLPSNANSDDLCTQAYNESNALCKSLDVTSAVGNTDDICTQVYTTDNTDDVCTQAYTESNALRKSTNALLAVVDSDDICTQAYTGENALCESTKIPAIADTDDICTQMYTESDDLCNSTDVPSAVGNTDDICTQAYTESHALRKSTNIPATANTDDVCTQAYTESNALRKSTNIPATTNTDDICTQAYTESNALRESTDIPATTNTDDICTQACTESNALRKSTDIPATTNADDICTQAYTKSNALRKSTNIPATANTDDICTQAYDMEADLNLPSTSKLPRSSNVSVKFSAVNTDDVCTQAFANTERSETQSLSETVESSQPLEDEVETGDLQALLSPVPHIGESIKTSKRQSDAKSSDVDSKRRRRTTAMLEVPEGGSSAAGTAAEGGRRTSRRSVPVETKNGSKKSRVKKDALTTSGTTIVEESKNEKIESEKSAKSEATHRKRGRPSETATAGGRKKGGSATVTAADKNAEKNATEMTEVLGSTASIKSSRKSVVPTALEGHETAAVVKRKVRSKTAKSNDGSQTHASSSESSENVEVITARRKDKRTSRTNASHTFHSANSKKTFSTESVATEAEKTKRTSRINGTANETEQRSKSRRKTATVTVVSDEEEAAAMMPPPPPTTSTRRQARGKKQEDDAATTIPPIVISGTTDALEQTVPKRARRSTRAAAGADSHKTADSAGERVAVPASTRKSRAKKENEVVVSSESPQSDPGPASNQLTVVAAGRKRRATATTSAVPSTPEDDTASKAGVRKRKSIEPPRLKVMFTGMVDSHGEKIVVSLDGQVVSCVNDCTFLVTDKVRRTVKFLCSMCRGIPIVSPKWLEDSQKAHKLLDATGYLVADRENEKKFGFRLADSLAQANTGPMLAGYRIHVTAGVKPEPDQMKDIVTCAGAKYLPKLPHTYTDQTVVVSCEEDHALCMQAVGAGIPVVNAEFILTGVLKQQADVQLYRLFAEESNRPSKQTSQTNARSRSKTKK